MDNVTSEISKLEGRLTDLISMEFVEMRSMVSTMAGGDAPTTCTCYISIHTFCWYGLIFIFEIICIAFIHITYSKTNDTIEKSIAANG